MELPAITDWEKANEDALTEMKGCFCVACEKSNGITLMLPTKIPHFREIYVTSFQCPDCGHCNSEANFGGAIQPKGERIRFRVTSKEDMNRQIIKGDFCTLTIPQFQQFEMPPSAQRGVVTTIEGILRQAVRNLEFLQPERLRLGDLDNFHRCQAVIERVKEVVEERQEHFSDPEHHSEQNNGCRGDEVLARDGATAHEKNRNSSDDNTSTFQCFDILLDDPSGNSFLENLSAPLKDPQLSLEKYIRTPNQNLSIGLQQHDHSVEHNQKEISPDAPGTIINLGTDDLNTILKTNHHDIHYHYGHSNDLIDQTNVKGEVLQFPTQCPACHEMSETNVCTIHIPHFKEVIVMCLLCNHCGFRSNEVKGGGSIPELGQRITLDCQTKEDLSREVIKSDTAGLAIPSLDLELEEGGFGGIYTTVEGLLRKIHSRLEATNPFSAGDSAIKQHLHNNGGTFSTPSTNHVRFQDFLRRLSNMADGSTLPFQFIISDPLGNSFLGPVTADASILALQRENDENNISRTDERIKIEMFERSHGQNEILGLNHLRD